MSNQLKRVLGVIGAGQMGGGIAYVGAVRANIPCIIVDQSTDQLKKCEDLAKKLLKKEVTREKLSQSEADHALSLMTYTNNIKDVKDCNFVVEAVSENLDLKKKIFSELNKNTSDDTILATNTSSISITKLQHDDITNRPHKIIGMHFMNPVPVMKLVEIISGLRTSNDTLETTLDLASKMGKTTTKSEDVPGFIANRILMPYINEAFLTLEHGVAGPYDIDTTMKLGTNVPMGPLHLADFIGLDTCLAIMEVLHQDFGDSKYRPSTLLRKYVDAGLLGVKTRQGVYEYDERGKIKL